MDIIERSIVNMIEKQTKGKGFVLESEFIEIELNTNDKALIDELFNSTDDQDSTLDFLVRGDK